VSLSFDLQAKRVVKVEDGLQIELGARGARNSISSEGNSKWRALLPSALGISEERIEVALHLSTLWGGTGRDWAREVLEESRKGEERILEETRK